MNGRIAKRLRRLAAARLPGDDQAERRAKLFGKLKRAYVRGSREQRDQVLEACRQSERAVRDE